LHAPFRDNLGHASISTTSQYLHADDDARHIATEQGLKLNWRWPRRFMRPR
jgi:integrase/recombinase XerD